MRSKPDSAGYSQSIPGPLRGNHVSEKRHPLNVFLIDDCRESVNTMQSLLMDSTVAQIVGNSPDEHQFLRASRKSRIDAVLLVVSEARPGSLNIVRKLRRLTPRIPTLVMTSATDPALVIRAFREGASAFVRPPLTALGAELIIHRVALGGVYASDSAVTALITALREVGSNQPVVKPLSNREEDIMSCLFRKCTDEEIGQELHIALGTVRTHLYRMFLKLDVKSRAEAMEKYLCGMTSISSLSKSRREHFKEQDGR
jgi:DNA-binding NarL/FixJ family response regulator